MKSKTKFILAGVLVAFALVLVLPLFASADVTLPNPIQTPGGKGTTDPTVIDIIIGSYLGFASLIAVFAFGFLIISGVKLITAHDNPEAITNARNGVIWSVLGLGAAILSVTIIFSTATFLGNKDINELSSPNALQIPINDAQFLDVFIRIFTGLLALAFVICVIMVIYAGLKMIFSSGNEEQITGAKTVLTWAIAGLAVVVLSYAIISNLNRLLCGGGGGSSCGGIETTTP